MERDRYHEPETPERRLGKTLGKAQLLRRLPDSSLTLTRRRRIGIASQRETSHSTLVFSPSSFLSLTFLHVRAREMYSATTHGDPPRRPFSEPKTGV